MNQDKKRPMPYFCLPSDLRKTYAKLVKKSDKFGIGMMLNAYCAAERNGGVIKGCKSWDTADWTINVGLLFPVPPKDEDRLWHWEGDDLHVDFYTFYPAIMEAKMEAEKAERSNIYRQNGEKRWMKDRLIKQMQDAGLDEAAAKRCAEEFSAFHDSIGWKYCGEPLTQEKILMRAKSFAESVAKGEKTEPLKQMWSRDALNDLPRI